MPRELYHERDVKGQRCHLKKMSRERERGKQVYKKRRCEENEINKHRDVKRKRCLQKKTQEKESLRDEMPREKDAKSREKCEQQAMPQEIWKKTAAVPARWLVEFVSQCSHPAQICSVWRSR